MFMRYVISVHTAITSDTATQEALQRHRSQLPLTSAQSRLLVPLIATMMRMKSAIALALVVLCIARKSP